MSCRWLARFKFETGRLSILPDTIGPKRKIVFVFKFTVYACVYHSNQAVCKEIAFQSKALWIFRFLFWIRLAYILYPKSQGATQIIINTQYNPRINFKVPWYLMGPSAPIHTKHPSNQTVLLVVTFVRSSPILLLSAITS